MLDPLSPSKKTNQIVALYFLYRRFVVKNSVAKPRWVAFVVQPGYDCASSATNQTSDDSLVRKKNV